MWVDLFYVIAAPQGRSAAIDVITGPVGSKVGIEMDIKQQIFSIEVDSDPDDGQVYILSEN